MSLLGNSIVVLVLWIHLSILSSHRLSDEGYNTGYNVHVSQNRGRDSPSCGLPSNPCKTIVMGVSRVEHDGRVYVDGTGSESSPYNCKSSVLELPGIHSNKNIDVIGVQSMPYVKCQEGYNIRLNQSPKSHYETTVNLTNLKFVSTSVSAQDIRLYIDNCVFTSGSQAVNLVQSTTKAVSLSFKNSHCTNMNSCIIVGVERFTPANKVSIVVTNSNITSSWYAKKVSHHSHYYSSGIHVTSTGEYDPTGAGLITCDIALKNVTFKHNVFGIHGVIFLDLENSLISLYLEGVMFYESKTTVKVSNMINILNSYSHDIVLINTKFLQNYQGSCGALQVKSKNQSTVHIANSQFEKFSTERNKLININTNHRSEVYIENAAFTSNTAMQNGGCLFLNGVERARITIKASEFINNSMAVCGGVIGLYTKVSLVTKIQGCHFESNTANNSAVLGVFLGNEVSVEIKDSRVIETNSFNGSMFNIGLLECDTPLWNVSNVSLVFKNVQIIRGFLRATNNPRSTDPNVGLIIVTAYSGSITVQDITIRDVRFLSVPNFEFRNESSVVCSIFQLSTDAMSKVGLDIQVLNSTIEYKSVKFSLPSRIFSCAFIRNFILESTIIDFLGEPLLFLSDIRYGLTRKFIINNSVIRSRVPFIKGMDMNIDMISLSVFSLVKITNTLIDSHFQCLSLHPKLYGDVILRNVTFKHCTGIYDGGSIYVWKQNKEKIKILIESCKFIGNKGRMGGALAFSMANRDKIINSGCINEGQESHRMWSYSFSVVVRNSLFANNTAIRGGALVLSRGNYTIQNCSFIDNFAQDQGGHIFVTSESTSLTITNSSFLQQRSTPEENVTFYIRSFIDSQAEGPLRLFDSKFNSTLLHGSSSTLVTVSKANYVNFGEDNQTVLTCPRGQRLKFLNFTTQIDTEHNSHECTLLMNVMKFICEPCPIGSYSLQHGQSLGTHPVSGFQCLSCPFGADCSNQISAKSNFWGYKVQENPPALNFTLCPLGYCKQPEKRDFIDYNSCHGNRTGILCGKCKVGFTETLLSPSCRRQNQCRDTWLWGVVIVMVLLMALYLINKQWLFGIFKRHIYFWSTRNTNQVNEEESPEDDDGGGYLKIIFYFYQVANILLTTTSYNRIVDNYLLQPVVGLFNFEIRLSSRDLLCPFTGLTAITKQLLFACPVFGVLLMIVLCYYCQCLLHRCKSKSPPTLGPFIGAALETLLLGYAVFANIDLKLLRCTSIDGELRLFLAGNVTCYQWWQYLLMVYLACVAVPFIVTLALGSRWLYRDSISVKEFFIGCVIPLPYLIYKLMSLSCGPQERRPEPPEWKASVTAVLYGPFRCPEDHTKGAIYWESILIFRRLILILINVFVPDPLSKESLLTFTCVLILAHHILIRPFRSQAANIAEVISLLGLVAIATINTFKASFLSFGQVPEGSMKSFLEVINWVEIIILCALPVLFVLAFLFAIVSQLIRLIAKILSSITCSCIQMQPRVLHVNDDQGGRLLDPCALEDSEH